MKPFFDALLSASLPYDPHLIKRLAGELKLKAAAEQSKLGKYDKSDALAGLIDNLSDFLAEIEAENEPKGAGTERLWATTSKVP